MKYCISTISDVVTEEAEGSWEKLSYLDRTRPLAVRYGLGLEIAEFCISDNMDNSFDDVLPHVESCARSVPWKTLHAPYNELFPMAIEPLVVEVAYRRYEQTLGYCQRFGADKMIVQLSTVRSQPATSTEPSIGVAASAWGTSSSSQSTTPTSLYNIL